MTLSEKLQTLRKAAGLSQEALAEQLGVTRQAVSKWETGEGKPDIDNLLPLAKLLHTTVDYLLDDTADAPRAEKSHPQPQTESVGRELWEQLKAFGRRWGWSCRCCFNGFGGNCKCFFCSFLFRDCGDDASCW